jgi:hypothetical protein
MKLTFIFLFDFILPIFESFQKSFVISNKTLFVYIKQDRFDQNQLYDSEGVFDTELRQKQRYNCQPTITIN